MRNSLRADDPDRKRPNDAVDITAPLPISVQVDGLPYNVTIHPWPTGIELPPVENVPTALTVGANISGPSWKGLTISVSDNERIIKFGSQDPSILQAPWTTPASSETPITISSTGSVPSAGITPTPGTPTTRQSISSPPGPSLLPTSTSQPNIGSAPSIGNTGLSNGAVAGIAIGCLFAGALLAGLLAWFCLGKSRKRSRKPDKEGSALAFLPREKTTGTAKPHSLESGSPISKTLDNALPQPSEDKAISGEIAKLESSIKNHVQSYYHNRSVSPGLLDLDDLHALGNNLPISTGTLSTLLGNSETRDIALRFVIAWVMVARMESHADPDTTFLPPEMARCFQIVSSDGTSRAHGLFLANWRRITAELLNSTYNQNSFSSSDPRNYTIGVALSILDAILQPYADTRMDNNQRRRNLEEILKRAASFAFTLFGHPSSWIFDWKEEQGVRSGSLCIFPALLQTSDDTGEIVKPPRHFSDAVVRTLDE